MLSKQHNLKTLTLLSKVKEVIESQKRRHIKLHIASQQLIPLLQRANQEYDIQYQKPGIENQARLEGLLETMSNELVSLGQPMCEITADESSHDNKTTESEHCRGQENHSARNIGKSQ